MSMPPIIAWIVVARARASTPSAEPAHVRCIDLLPLAQRINDDLWMIFGDVV
jgi:hypothetical protein